MNYKILGKTDYPVSEISLGTWQLGSKWGEPFSGVDYETGLTAAKELTLKLGTDSLALSALRYILMYDAVSTIIPGASSAIQITENAKASSLPASTAEQMAIVEQIYNRLIRPRVHHAW